MDHRDLDDLTPEQIDALPFGVIQVDANGTVLIYNATESRFSGRSVERTVGRDFFREVAPCTHLPAFHGRFLDGVRRGDLDTAFGFTFGFDPPARVAVHLRASRQPDRYWIVVQQLGVLAPSRQRIAAAAAQETVNRRSRAEPVDASLCELEPIHLPGAVQPHAAMIAFDLTGLKVVACSDNLADATGRGPKEVLGLTLADLLPAALADDLAAALASGALAVPNRPWQRSARLGPEGRPFALTAHRNDGRLVLELEMLPDDPADFGAATPNQAQAAVRELRAADSLNDAANACADYVRAMTGFERVLVYRFDADWNGEAVGESRNDSYPSLLGLRFPASDIPAQARALYVRAPARFVVDRDAVPAAVLAQPGAANQSVDLSFAYSRALSPVHLEYQRNLGVNGSMSVSIVVDGVLWGLVIGHHRRPHYVTPDTRALVGLVADALALRVHELATTLAWREQQAALQHQNALLRQLAGTDDFVNTLTAPATGVSTLLDLFDATGAAVVDGERVATLGASPPPAVVRALSDWLRDDLPSGQRVFATADLSEHWPDAAAMAATASGLLAAFVDSDRRDLLLWFRPEVAGTIAWGGDPNKPVLADSATRTVLPRRSFERWVEERRGQAVPWAPWQIDAAGAFAEAVEGVVLRQGRTIAELSAKQRDLTAALEQKDLLAREIDHRVKNSLQIVAGVLSMQARRMREPEAKAAFQDTYARVMSVARVHDSLQQASDAETVDLGETLRQLCGDLSAGLAEAQHPLSVAVEPGLMVPSRTAVALALIATELITNARKYAYAPGEAGPINVEVRARDDGRPELMICDEGQGLPADWETRPRTQGGLGMRVIRAMLQQIEAEMAVDGQRERGTCFTVTT